MANDRMYLRCVCGDDFMLAKHFVKPWATKPDLEAKLDAWFEKHAVCGSMIDAENQTYPTHPRLVYESDDDYITPEMTAAWEQRTGKSFSEVIADIEKRRAQEKS
jgi:hypothetical protein